MNKAIYRYAVAISRWGYLAVLVPALVAQTSQSASNDRLHQAVIAAERGDPATAYRITQDLLAQNPEFEPALRLQGILLDESGRSAEAETVYRRALAISPSDSEVAMKLGILQLVSGKVDDAIRLLEQRTQHAPKDGDALYYLAQAYHLKGNHEAALRAIQKSQEADPTNPSVWQKYGELLCSAGENEKAIGWLKKAQQADPTLPRINFDLAVANYNNQDLENAAQFANKAVGESPDDLQGLALLGAIQVKLSQWAEGEVTFQKILAVHNDDAASLLGLGHCELSLKKYQLAIAPLEKVLQQDSTLVLAHFYLSRAYTGLGRTADAEREAAIHRKLLEAASSPGAK